MKIKTVYQCTSCGYQSPKWAGKCPDCGEWNTLAETAQVKGGAKAAKAAPKQPVSRLSEVETGSDQRLLTGIAEFDRVIGIDRLKALHHHHLAPRRRQIYPEPDGGICAGKAGLSGALCIGGGE